MFITEWMRIPVLLAASRISCASSSRAMVCISMASKPAARAMLNRSAYGRSFGSIEMRMAFRIPDGAAACGARASAGSGVARAAATSLRKVLRSCMAPLYCRWSPDHQHEDRRTQMKPVTSDISRRTFLESVAAAGAAAVAAAATAEARTAQSAARPLTVVKAPDGAPLKAGLIGCGGRGRGAAETFLEAGPGLQIVALADLFEDRVMAARKLLTEKRGQQIPESRCFTGFDGYKKLLDSGVDLVLHATPPHFRPMHMAAVVEAGKHLFREKPVAVDVPGVKAVMQTAERASQRGLAVVTGTQLRRDLTRIAVRERILGGEIGDIRALRAIRNQGALWYRVPQAGWSDMGYMVRDWVNWTWLSGDIIVEQHIHHLDAMLWVMGKTPLKATGMGAHARRPTGDQYDFFSVDYEFDNGLHMHSTIRQLNGCANER